MDIYELPSHLTDDLVSSLPPAGLYNFQLHLPFQDLTKEDFLHEDSTKKRKCSRDWNLNITRKKKFELQWPNLINQIQPTDRQKQNINVVGVHPLLNGVVKHLPDGVPEKEKMHEMKHAANAQGLPSDQNTLNKHLNFRKLQNPNDHDRDSERLRQWRQLSMYSEEEYVVEVKEDLDSILT
ncbi:hypothetical protein RYX36_031598 [Vicia faba]